VVIPKLGIDKKIQKGLNVVEFTPTQTGVLPFSCWMGMLNGRFIVTD
jgi:plastocyanin domain-containing protein